MCRAPCLALSLLLIGFSLEAAETVKFVAPPRVVREGSQTKISFALDRPADVEVAVLNAKGQIVRHLAAGLLGQDAPPPPLKTGLEQQLVWDGRDDLDQPAAGGPFQVRIRAGMSVRFGRMIGASPYTGSVVSMPYRAPVNGLVADAQGNLYVKLMSSVGSHGNSGHWPWHLREFDPQGAYRRTVLPYPPSTAPSRATGYELLDTPGRFTPANRNSLYPVFATFGNELCPRLVDGQIVFVHSEARQLNLFALDGSNRVKTITMWPESAKLKCPLWLDIQVAVSPDGRTAYYSNVAGTAYDGRQPSDIDEAWPQGRIYRHDLAQADSTPAVFFDLTLPDFQTQRYWMPSAWDKKTAASGIDTDAHGNVLVGDLVNHAVVEISPDGKLLSTTSVPWPDKVLVSRKTGDLYVISRKVSRGYLPPATLVKIKGRGESARTVAELPLAGTIGGACTLDESRSPPVLWLAGQERESERDSHQLLRVEDQGDKLVVTGDRFLNRDESAITFVGYMDVDPEAELVYVTRSGGTVWRFDGETGAGGPLPIKAVDLAVGPGGDIFTWGTTGSYDGPIGRFTRDLQPVVVAKDAKEPHTYGYLYGRAGRGSSVCGLDVDARGRVFATYGSNECHVRVYDADGKPVSYPRSVSSKEGSQPAEVPAAIAGVTGYGGSLRVDRAGNIYLLQAGVSKDFRPPPGFENDEAFRNAVGTIYKFPPVGGEVQTRGGSVTGVTGAIAEYPGCGPVSRWRAVGACACTKPRFDVDGFGRLYVTNGITYSVSVLDNAGRQIVQFGGYGNFDSQGPGSREPQPEIPLGWPITAGASDRAIYVGDCLNHRVVRVDKQFAAEAAVPVAAP